MKMQIKRTMAILLTVCFVLSITAATVSAAEGNPNSRVLPVNSNPEGKSYGEWSEKWWQWSLSIPKDKNPVLDETGAFCAEGQSGNVWFLAGTWGKTGVVRNCNIPAGKAIFFPIVNAECSVVEGDGNNENELRTKVESMIPPDKVTLEVIVDGTNLKDLSNYRVGSRLFEFTLPENNVIDKPAGPSQAVSVGYWIMLAPLPEGKHTIHIHGKVDSTFETEVTYNLNIVPSGH